MRRQSTNSLIITPSIYPSIIIRPSLLPQQPDVLETFNRGAMVGLLVVAVAIAMVMVVSLLLVRRKPYGTISHGIVEVRNSSLHCTAVHCF